MGAFLVDTVLVGCGAAAAVVLLALLRQRRARTVRATDA
jgi:hypothetical protein